LAEKDFPHASTIDGLRFTAQVILPITLQGLFRRRRALTRAATLGRADAAAIGLVASLRNAYGNGPLWLRAGTDDALLLIGRDAVRHALECSPDPFAADAEPKRSGMRHFQPEALTISREPEWSERRRFAEGVLESDRPVHRFGDRFAAVAAEEAAGLPEEIDWPAWSRAVRRVTRRVVLGDRAAGDDELSTMLSDLMDKANPPGDGDDELLARFEDRLARHVAAAQDGSLAALIGQAPGTDIGHPAGQVTHWLFALGDTLAVNALRCLVALAAYVPERARVQAEIAGADLGSGIGVAGLVVLRACLQETMRLWPTSPILMREAVRDVEWDGVRVPAGTRLIIVNTFNHRDRETNEWAERFDPDRWLSGEAGEDWMFNQFSHGPQGCPGASVALAVGTAMLAAVLRDREPAVLAGGIDSDQPPPPALDFFAVRVALRRR
jgi:cytochrome P450